MLTWDNIKEILNIITPICVVFALIYNYWLNTIRPKIIKEKEEKVTNLTEKQTQYNRIKGQIQENLELIKSNDLSKTLTINYSKEIIDNKIKNDITNYLEQYSLYSDIYEGCVCVIRFNVQFYASQLIPKSLQKHPIDNILNDLPLIKQYLEGNCLSANWLRENHNDKYHIIIKYLDDSEGEKNLDEFFKQFNNVILNDMIIKRFRKEKSELINISDQILLDLDKEIKNLEIKLKE
jgi:hypothetical protein